MPDGVFVSDGEGLRFEMLPVPTSANVLAILDRVMRRIAGRLAKDVTIGDVDDNARHLVRYSGVFGPAGKHRAKLRALVPATDRCAELGTCTGSGASTTSSAAPPPSRSRRLPWADLLRRVFADDVLAPAVGVAASSLS